MCDCRRGSRGLLLLLYLTVSMTITVVNIQCIDIMINRITVCFLRLCTQRLHEETERERHIFFLQDIKIQFPWVGDMNHTLGHRCITFAVARAGYFWQAKQDHKTKVGVWFMNSSD